MLMYGSGYSDHKPTKHIIIIITLAGVKKNVAENATKNAEF